MAHEIDAGQAVFCSSCSRLFRRYGGTSAPSEDDDDDGRPRCSDCAAKQRLQDAVQLAAHTRELQHSPGTLSRLVALAAEADDESPRRGSLHSLSMHASAASTAALDEEREAGVAALHDLIVFTRRENNELRKRLHAAQHEAAYDIEAVDHEAAAEAGEDGGPIGGLTDLMETILPIQLRQTVRYRPLGECLIELRAVWRDRERRLHALQAALLGAEATGVTLQEELLLVESSEVTLGSLVQRQQAELAHVRGRQQEIEASVEVKEHAARHAEVRRAEAEGLLRLRHDAEAGLRAAQREMQRILADAHTSLGQFISTQQTRRAKELEARMQLFDEIREEIKALVSAAGGAGGAQAAGERRALVESMREVLDGGMREHTAALADLDSRRREADSLEREWYERRIEALEGRVQQLEGLRADILAQTDGVSRGSAERSIELLRKQRDEGFHAREMAVDDLRQRVTQEQHRLEAMRAAFGECSDQLKAALAQLPVSDDSLAAEREERNTLRRHLDAARARLAELNRQYGERKFLQSVWSAWRELLARSFYARASTHVKRVKQSGERKRRDALKAGEESAKQYRAEVKRVTKQTSELGQRLESARKRDDDSTAAAAEATAAKHAMRLRVEEAEGVAAAKTQEAQLLGEALEQARSLEALWYEQREALLDEAEALRKDLEMRGEYTKATKGKWRAKANELAAEADEQGRVAAHHREVAEELQRRLELAVADGQHKQDELDELQRLREKEIAMHETASPSGAHTGSNGAAVYSGQAEGLSPDVHGAGWLIEARERQAHDEAREATTLHFKERCVALSRARRREKMMLGVWRGWSGLVESTRRRQADKLHKMAGEMLAVAASAPDGGRRLLGTPGATDHEEWWIRGTKKPLPRSPPVDVSAVV